MPLVMDQALLFPRSKGQGAVGPSPGIGGNPLVMATEYGQAIQDNAAGTVPPTQVAARNPKRCISPVTGVHYKFSEQENNVGADNTATAILVQQSNDGGVTWTNPAVAASPSTYPGKTTGVSLAINGFDPQMLSDGTCVLAYTEMPYSSTSATATRCAAISGSTASTSASCCSAPSRNSRPST